MSDQPERMGLPSPIVTSDAPDPELEALPEPRRPGRRVTLGVLVLTLIVSLLMAFALWREAAYALQSGPPVDAGNLSSLDLADAKPNSWVRGEGALGTAGSIRYSRPLDSDTFRLAPVTGHDRLWIEIRVPAGLEGPRFVPPSSFVGRLVPLAHGGLRYAGLKGEVARTTDTRLSGGEWLLVDGESPAGLRWVLGLFALFIGFAAFNGYGLYRLMKPIRDR